jgi:site-specific recombinase XerD
MKARQRQRETEELLAAFSEWLVVDRGLANVTASNYVSQAKRFLGRLPAPLGNSLARLDAPGVIALIAEDVATGAKRSSTRTRTGALRTLLRFLYVRGVTPTLLADAVPKVANWHYADVPRFLPAGHVDALLQAHDSTDPVDVRNHAMVMLLARLGLRAGEVAALRLADVDWRQGRIKIRSKGSHVEPLPLSQDVGSALGDYILNARPRCECDAVFVSVLSPYTSLTRHAVANVVYRASVRVGLPPFRPHRLRHTLASDLLRAGSPLVEIGQILRHRSVMTTAIYAKVDFASLSALARPWPEVVS